MKPEDKKTLERQRERERYFKFLDRRIPELHNEGKPFPGSPPEGMDLAERCKRHVANTEGSKYPGVKARRQADLEWAEMR